MCRESSQGERKREYATISMHTGYMRCQAILKLTEIEFPTHFIEINTSQGEEYAVNFHI